MSILLLILLNYQVSADSVSKVIIARNEGIGGSDVLNCSDLLKFRDDAHKNNRVSIGLQTTNISNISAVLNCTYEILSEGFGFKTLGLIMISNNQPNDRYNRTDYDLKSNMEYLFLSSLSSIKMHNFYINIPLDIKFIQENDLVVPYIFVSPGLKMETILGSFQLLFKDILLDVSSSFQLSLFNVNLSTMVHQKNEVIKKDKKFNLAFSYSKEIPLLEKTEFFFSCDDLLFYKDQLRKDSTIFNSFHLGCETLYRKDIHDFYFRVGLKNIRPTVGFAYEYKKLKTEFAISSILGRNNKKTIFLLSISFYHDYIS